MILASEQRPDRLRRAGRGRRRRGVRRHPGRGIPRLDRHLGIADLVVLNKADRIGDAARQRLMDTLADLAAGRPRDPRRIRAGRSRAALRPRAGRGPRRGRPPAVLRGPAARDRSGRGPAHGSTTTATTGLRPPRPRPPRGHLHAAYESVAFTSDEPLHPRRLMDFLDSRPEGLYRIKGYVDFGVRTNRQKLRRARRRATSCASTRRRGRRARSALHPARPDRHAASTPRPCARSWRTAARDAPTDADREQHVGRAAVRGSTRGIRRRVTPPGRLSPARRRRPASAPRLTTPAPPPPPPASPAARPSRPGAGPAPAAPPGCRSCCAARAGAAPAQARVRQSSPFRNRWQRTPPVARPLRGYWSNGVSLAVA